MSIHIASFSGGKDSTAMTLMLIEKGWPLDEIVFFDTGWEFPEMYDHIAKFEEYTGRKVTVVRPRMPLVDLMLKHPIRAKSGINKGQIHRIGMGWPSMTRRWCTREKVAPLDKYCKGAQQYIGIAADEAQRMASANLMSNKTRRFPLVEWGMTEAACLAYCRERGFDWNGLYDIFTRVSCFCCPLQRIGDLRKLRKHFPELWTIMLKWDAKIGKHNKGFRGYDTVHDLDKRFAAEDWQQELFK